MRIDRRRWSAAIAVLLVVALLTLAALFWVRWRAAGEPQRVVPPAEAAGWRPDGAPYEIDVSNRGVVISLGMRNDRGDATVRIYQMPPHSPWSRAVDGVAAQLEGWERLDDCADRPEARTLECSWREPTRWWPREVQLTMLRRPPAEENPTGWPDHDFLIIGSGLGAD
ncbi:hypothetical protein [Actinoplanes missouriensis]|uniref:hypothetical protein n=1 Tax=Actinoplanes missouriensis TaxID=1866 RepID=UPI0036866ED3